MHHDGVFWVKKKIFIVVVCFLNVFFRFVCFFRSKEVSCTRESFCCWPFSFFFFSLEIANIVIIFFRSLKSFVSERLVICLNKVRLTFAVYQIVAQKFHDRRKFQGTLGSISGGLSLKISVTKLPTNNYNAIIYNIS